MNITPWHFFVVALAGWINREQQQVIEYLQTENQVLREQIGARRIRFTDEQRRRLAVLGREIGRKALSEIGSIVTPDTILRWYRRLVARKYDGSKKRGPGPAPPALKDPGARPCGWRRNRRPGATPASVTPCEISGMS